MQARGMTTMRRPFERGLRGESRRGQVMILLTAALTVLMVLGGLAVDMIYAYTIKVRLVTAVDAVALGVARALGRGVTISDQQTEVARTAQMLFRSNFPSNFMLTGATSLISAGPTIAGPNVPVGTYFETDATVPQGVREVRLTGEVRIPLFFMRIFKSEIPIRAGAKAARRDVNVMMVLDRSGSMTAAWPDLRDAAIYFMDQFDNSTDQLGIVMFGTSSRVDLTLNTGFKTGNVAENIIMGQTTPANAFTNSSWGLWQGYAELLENNDPNALNVIVFFTDGNPTSYTASFNVLTSPPSSGTRPWCDASPVEAAVGTSGNFDWDVTNMRRFATPYAQYPANIAVGGRDYVIVDGTGANQVCHSYATSGSNRWLTSAPYAENVERVFAAGCLPQNWTPSYKNATSPKTFSTESTTNGPGYGVNPCDSNLKSEGSSSSLRGRHVHRTAKTLAVNVASDARLKTNSLGGAMVYTIGLGTVQIDDTFLKRLANDPLSTDAVTNGTQTAGVYVASPTPSQLRQAFQIVANHIFRLIS